MQAHRKLPPSLLNIRLLGPVPFRTADEHREALSLIQRLLAKSRGGISSLKCCAADLEPLSGGRSDAHVFKVTPFFGPARQTAGSRFIVKISPRADAECEKANYDKFVRWALPAHCRPDLLGFARGRERSALSYSFVGGRNGSSLDTLTVCLQRGDITQLDLLLAGIFDPIRAAWYSPTIIRAESDIARRYLERYFTGRSGPSESDAVLRAHAVRYFGAQQNNGRLNIGGAWFSPPQAVLFAPGKKLRYHSCILHGDLNSDNIFVDLAQARVTLVDFRRTGRGHVYEDLVALEASIRINYPPDASFGEIFETERLIAGGQQQFSDNRYAASIRKVRDAAFRYFGCFENEATYNFAVAAVGLRLMQAVDLSHIARARVTASAVWAAKNLNGVLST